MAELPSSIGWIGLGIMGNPMIMNLLEKMPSNTQFFVHDVVQKNVDRLVQKGAGRVNACSSGQKVGDKSELIVTMLPEGSHVKSVYLDSSTGILSSLSISNKVLIDCSTIDTGSSLSVRDAAQNVQARFFDAPVSGGPIGADKGSLTIMLGCAASDPDLPLLNSLLSLVGGNIFPCGGASLGLTAKLCNNYCSSLITLALSEAFNTGIRSGMDPRVLANIFHTSTSQSRNCDDNNPVPGISPEGVASHGYKGGFRVELMRKDFRLAMEASERVGAKLVLGEAGLKAYSDACEDERCKGLDSRVVYRFLGGEEEWLQKGGFQDKVSMKRDDTKRWIALGKQIEEQNDKHNR